MFAEFGMLKSGVITRLLDVSWISTSFKGSPISFKTDLVSLLIENVAKLFRPGSVIAFTHGLICLFPPILRSQIWSEISFVYTWSKYLPEIDLPLTCSRGTRQVSRSRSASKDAVFLA